MTIPRRKIIILLGMMSKMPVAGVVWQTIHYLIGFRRLGYDVYYIEAHARTPGMLMTSPTDDGSANAAAFIDRVMCRFGLQGKWAYQALHDDGRCFGLSDTAIARLFDEAELVINLHGGTKPRPEHFARGRLVYLETDPVTLQIELHEQQQSTIEFLAPHFIFFTFGENYGRPSCQLPVSTQFKFIPTRQPVIMDFWRPFRNGPSEVFTTIGNYKQQWREVAFNGEMYHWSKHHEFLKIIDLPRRTSQPFELALGSCEPQEQKELEAHGWRIRGADEISTDADQYRRYITTSRGEFTVAKDQNVRLKSGWFSDRSATYLASGLPVITQDTAFDAALPVGKGLFAFSNLEQAADAVEAINADYPGNQRTSEEIAREYFAHDKVLGPLLEACGLARLAIAPRPAAPPAPPLEALRARVEVQCPPIVEPASVLKLSCEVENLGSACMLSLPPNPVFVSYKWFDAKTGQRFEHEGLRTSLPGTLLPRGHAKCELIVRTPAVEGEFILRATLVQEYISWFDDLDAASACNVRVTVRSAAPAVPALTEAASR